MLRGGGQTEQSDLINQRGINTDGAFNVTSVLNDERTDSSQEVAAAYSKCLIGSKLKTKQWFHNCSCDYFKL